MIARIISGILIYALAVTQVVAQTAALLPNAKQTFLGTTGAPLAAGTVTLYTPNSTNKKTTWVDPNQASANTNPVVLDAAGRAVIFGQGNYRQVVKDKNGVTIWDAFTSAYGSASPSGATGTDTAPVGTVIPYSGFVVPTNWQLAYGQPLNRTTFAQLLTAITISNNTVSCTASSTTLTGFVSTASFSVGNPIEATCLPANTTVASITNSSTIVVSQAAVSSGTVIGVVFPWGNGDGISTFNVPDLRGRTFAGADAMGGTASARLTATYYGANPAAPGVAGGSQSHTLIATELPIAGYNSAVTDPGHSHTAAMTATTYSVSNQGSQAFQTSGSGLAGNGSTDLHSVTTGIATTGITVTTTVPSGGNPHSIVQPTLTVNYIIKVAPNSSGAGGVVSIGGMFGDIICDATFLCANQTIGLAAQLTGTILANIGASTMTPTAVTFTQLMDEVCGSTQGDIIYRGAISWNCLPPASGGQALLTGGPGANPSWQAVVSTGLANPIATMGLEAVNGIASTAMRSDASPALPANIYYAGALQSSNQQPEGLAPVWSRVGVAIDPTASHCGVNYQAAEHATLYDTNPQILTSYTHVFKIWYHTGGAPTNYIYYAESPDGINWTCYTGNPVIPGGWTMPHSIVKNGSTYILYPINVSTGAIDRYTSPDGVNFTLANSNVLVPASSGFEGTSIFNPFVWREDSTHWKMMYTGNGSPQYAMGLATSSDGITWTKSGSNPVIAASTGGPYVYKANSGTYYLWTQGQYVNNTISDIYLYSSTNLTSWSLVSTNCVFCRGTTDEGAGLTNSQVADPSLLQANGKTYLFYQALQNQTFNDPAYVFPIKVAIANMTMEQLVAASIGAQTQGALPIFDAGAGTPSMFGRGLNGETFNIQYTKKGGSLGWNIYQPSPTLNVAQKVASVPGAVTRLLTDGTNANTTFDHYIMNAAGTLLLSHGVDMTGGGALSNFYIGPNVLCLGAAFLGSCDTTIQRSGSGTFLFGNAPGALNGLLHYGVSLFQKIAAPGNGANQAFLWNDSTANRPKFNYNGGSDYTLVGSSGSLTSGNCAKWDANGNLVDAATACGANMIVGTTPITSGTSTRIFYDNAGVLGEYTISGTGTVVAMQTSPIFVTDITMPIAKLSGTSNQLVFQSGGVTGTMSWTPSSTNKTITWPNGSTDFTATGGTSQFLKQASIGAAITVAQPACGDLSNSTALCSTSPGTGVATALGVNVGTAGAFVVNGGVLGSPSSAGTIPAFTLGGTIAGGGNQINNVIIGTSTPLAGSFTTLSGSTSVASPLLTLGTVSSVTGALKLANASSANLTTIQAGNAAAARTYTWPTNFGAAGTVLTDAAGNGTLSWASATATPAILSAKPADPAAGASGIQVQEGLGTTCHITPSYSSRVHVEFNGQFTNDTSGSGTNILISYGTGTAPANGAAVTGTQVGSGPYYIQQAANVTTYGLAFSNAGIATGLTPGVAYWFDLQIYSTAGVVNLRSIGCTAFEL